LAVYGEYLAAGEVIGRIQREGVLFQRSGGGLTVSGGEPLNQPEFLLRLLAEAKKSGSGPPWRPPAMAALKYWPQAAGYLDTILYDVKTVDPLRHRQFAGADNELILRNLLRLAESRPKLHLTVRTPVIPSFNDFPEAAGDLGRFLAQLPGVKFEALPYHRLGQSKHAFLDRPWLMGSLAPADGAAEEFRNIAAASRRDAESGR
jgi:pyruvate formate lyase activating enzyme